jgi:hypothetical protein
MDGGVLSDNYSITSQFDYTDYFFPNSPDANFQQSVITTI